MLAFNNNCELKLDISTYKNYKWHEYSLKPFDLSAKIANSYECSIAKDNNLTFTNKVLKKINQ